MNFTISQLLSNWNINFYKYKKISFISSFVFIFLAIFALFVNGLNFGIDFTGGVLLEISNESNISLNELNKTFTKKLNLNSITIQQLNNKKDLIIKIKFSNNDIKDIELIKNLLKEYNFTYKKLDYVGPQVSKSFIKKGVSALILGFVGIFIYLMFTFNYKYGLGGVLALIHDVIIIIGIYALFKIEFNISAVAAILTVIGYSINDSVVIFDRIRENFRRFENKIDLLNFSINSTLSRTILTSFTTLLAILPVIFFCIGEVKDFAIIIFSGIIVGTYSSIFIASFLALPKNLHTEAKVNEVK